MEFTAAAVERAMTYQQVIMRALAGTWTWLQAADVLKVHPRSLRRWRARYERDGVTGLLDARRRRPSHRTAPRAEVQRILALYRDRYRGFNVRHFYHFARRDLFTHTPHRAHRDQPFDAEQLQRKDISPGVDVRRHDAVPTPVAWEKGDGDAVPAADHHRVRWLSIGGAKADLFDRL